MQAPCCRSTTCAESPPPNGFADFVAQDLRKSKFGQNLRPAVDDRYLGDGLPDRPAQGGGHRQAAGDLDRVARGERTGFQADRQDRLWLSRRRLRLRRDLVSRNFLLVVERQGLDRCKARRLLRHGPQRRGHRRQHALLQVVHRRGTIPRPNLTASDAHDPAILQALVTGKQAIGAMPPNTYKQVLEAYAAANPGQTAAVRLGPFPKGSVTRSSNIGGRMLVINANSQASAEAAWKLVRYLASEPVFTKYYTHPVPGADARC